MFRVLARKLLKRGGGFEIKAWLWFSHIHQIEYAIERGWSIVPVLFREVFSHPYISFFHLLVNGFSVIIIIIIIIRFFRLQLFRFIDNNNNSYNNPLLQTGFLGMY